MPVSYQYTPLKIFLVLCTLLTAAAVQHLSAKSYTSGSKKVPLIELYTSEGCSSCPPADAWLSQLVSDEGLWQRFVPIAFHVDYWDYIGWQDPFAKPANSLRQRRYREQGNIKGVYTPGFIFMGNEWKTWYLQRVMPKVDWGEVGELKVDIKNKIAYVEFKPSGVGPVDASQLKLNFSVLGFDLATKVKRGENRGKVLKHNFVSLSHEKRISSVNEGVFKWQVPLPARGTTDKRKAIAVWVSETNSQQPLQSTGGWL